MKISFIHVSDFHNVTGKEELQPVILRAFFEDLKNQIAKINVDNIYFCFSGDLVQSGSSTKQYDDMFDRFDGQLNALGITKNKRILVPGNHDICRDTVKNNILVHDPFVRSKMSESDFNDHINSEQNILKSKFSNYSKFENRFADFGATNSNISGSGFNIGDHIAVYCMNTALCSSGGLSKDGKEIDDKGHLRIDTRTLHKWIQECNSRYKILLMHHPLHWLEENSRSELQKIIKNDFAVRLYGHEHEQDWSYSYAQIEKILSPVVLRHYLAIKMTYWVTQLSQFAK